VLPSSVVVADQLLAATLFGIRLAVFIAYSSISRFLPKRSPRVHSRRSRLRDSNPFRIKSFADPHQVTLAGSYLYEKGGSGSFCLHRSPRTTSPLSPSDATLTSHHINVDSKGLTETLSLLDATLTKNRGVASPLLLRTIVRALLVLLVVILPLQAQSKRKVIIDQDAAGPGGTDMQAILTLVNSPETDVLGITVLTGDAWRDEEVQHTLRLMEIIGRTDIPVVPGAIFPLVSSKEYIAKWETLYGKVVYQGAWNFGHRNAVHGPYEIPPMPEGTPTTKPASEDAAHFMVRMVHQYPHDVTIYAAGPMTDLALAIALDPHFPELTKELIVMGGSINPQTDNPEFALSPRREFNFWMDPEASHAVLHAHWPRFVLTTVDISVKTKMEKSLIDQIGKSQTPAAQYVAKYAEANILWDELAAAAWLDPSIITKWQKLYIDVEVDHGASYGDTHAWAPGSQPGMGEALVEVQQDLDKEKFYKEYVELLTRPTPPPRAGASKAN
jgi:purine nucleosidase